METLGRFGHKSLPTYYKGITFRSRLEARWAIILDELAISWEYEPEPILIEHPGISSEPYESFGYLPDFYLPKYDSFLEIKGVLDEKTYIEILKIAHSVTKTAAWYPKNNKEGRPFFLAGPLLNAPLLPVIWSVYNRKGNIYASPFVFHKELEYESFFCSDQEKHLGDDSSWEMPDDQANSSLFTLGINAASNNLLFPWERAVNKARKTRFDRGHNV